MKLELEIEKTADGLYNADYTYQTSDGLKHSVVSLHKSNIFCAIIEALDPLLIMAPNLLQDELDRFYEQHYY